MKHAHRHTHPGAGPDGSDLEHGHFHEHAGEIGEQARDTEFRKAHAAAPHEHGHDTREVTIPVVFTVGTLKQIGLGGFKTGWLDAEQDGHEFSLTAGAGVGSPYLEGSARGGGQPSVYAQADIRHLAQTLWDILRQAQSDAAVPQEEKA